MRALLIIALCCVGACHPAAYAAIAVAPRPTARADSSARVAFALIARIAARRSLKPFVNRDGEGWIECFARSAVWVCGKVRDQEIHFLMLEGGWFRLTPEGEGLRRELLDSLRVQFGQPLVRECKWRVDHNDPGRSGCPPIAQRDSS
jgi:hypothetical protein